MNDPFDDVRLGMVEQHLCRRGVSDPRALEAFRPVPRHWFVKPSQADKAYEDHPLEIGCGQTISQPYMVASMVECLALEGSERVLEVGTGSGYEAAILAQLAREVFSVERYPELARAAQDSLERIGLQQVKIRTGDGSLGWLEESPFDAIIVSCAAPEIPTPLVDQLALRGRMAVPVGGPRNQDLILVERGPNGVQTRKLGACVFVPMIGAAGFSN